MILLFHADQHNRVHHSEEVSCSFTMTPCVVVERLEGKQRNSPSHNHNSAAPRQHPLICTGAGLIHPVHGQPMSFATKAIPRNGVTFSPFLWAFLLRQIYFVHTCGLYVYCALVDLDSSSSPGARPTPGLTSNTQVVCVCVCSEVKIAFIIAQKEIM